MNSVEKRRTSRKSGGHRKHSDGSYSDTSSGGSFLDETDREVSNLTDRAFRSLCIGDEAVYNDSDPCSSSPCSQRDRQQAFSQSDQDRDSDDREREELKRAAHESFSLRVQQYGQDWIHGGMYGAKIHRDPQWEVYGESAQGRVSATFQHSLVEASQQEESLREEQLSILTNGATELSSQHRRSRSRVSSLIRAFNSEGHKDGTGSDGKLREWNDETSWDKSALMNIQRELSEFSTSYQQNFNSGHFPSAGLFSSQDNNFYSSQVASVAHMNSEPSCIRSSHSKHSVSAQVNCNSNFFIHSEFSPFKVWRDHNRFPFQQGEVSGFMHCSEFPKWYETPMYKEISLEAQPQGLYRFEERGIRHPRNNLASVVAPTPSRSTSTSTMSQKALAVEKRSESELAGQYPHRKQTQSLGTNRLPTQRPSTASPTIEMSRRVQDTISSVKALQQKIKMMTEQNIKTGMTANQQGVLCCKENVIPFGNNVKTVVPNVVSSNTSTTSFSISQLLTPLVHAHQEVETSEVQQDAVSPKPVEHPPVRAESRGATPDVRMSSYKSRATSLLFNLKDNRKRVKSTYSPTKYKGLETMEKTKQHSIREPRDIVIDIPDFADSEIQFPQVEESSSTNAPSDQYVAQYHSPGLSLTALNSQPATAHTGQYSEYSQPAQMQSDVVHHSGFTTFKPENYTSHQLANGQNLHNDLSPFTPHKQGITDNVDYPGDVYMLKPSITNPEQHVNETVEREFTKGDKYQLLKNDCSNVSSQDKWRQTNSQDRENLSLETAISPWKQEIRYLLQKDQHPQTYERAATIKEELDLPRDKYRGANQQKTNKEPEKMESKESFGVGASHKNTGLVNISNQLGLHDPAYYGQQQHEAFKDKHFAQKYYGQNRENEKNEDCLTQNHNRYTDRGYSNQQTFNSNNYQTMITQETSQRKLNPTGHGMQILQPIEAKPEFEHNMQTDSLFKPADISALTRVNPIEHRQIVEVKAEQAMAEHIKPQHTQAELAELFIQREPAQVKSSGLILAGQTGSEKVRAEEAKAELSEHKKVNQGKEEHVKVEKTKEEQTEQFREKQSDRPREEQTKTLQTRVQKQTEEIGNIEIGAKHMREVQDEHVKTEEAKAERLKEEHIKTELAKIDPAGLVKIKQTKTVLTRGERFKPQQLEEEQVGGDQMRTDNVKAEQAEAEKSKVEKVKPEEMTEQQTKPEQDKMKVVEDDSIQEGQINEDHLREQISKAKDKKVKGRKDELAKLEQTKVELAKPELTKTENLQERSAKSAAKLTGTQQVKSETDKVERVKTELAKAKAELAKMKEKMISEQTDKARNASLTKEVPLRVNINKYEEYNDQDQTAQKNPQSEDSVVVSRKDTHQVNRGADDYERLREKYGLIETISTNRHKMSAAGNSNDNNETSALPHDKVETTNNKESKDKRHTPTKTLASANIENKEEVDGFKPNKMTESHYVYSESSKEFKLSGTDYLLSNVDRANSAATDKVKDDIVEKLEKRDTLKLTHVSQQRDSGLAKSLHLERKPKSTEHSVGQGNESNFTPTRALSHKERAHTKQEILTSRIKAHAEKEISAIKERSFATRDGFISKSSTKQLAGSLNINIRQRPPSQEVSKNQESTMSSNTTPKQQMEPPGVQTEPVMSPSYATIPVKSAANTIDLVDHSQEQVRKESMNSNNSVPKPPIKAKQKGSHTMSTDEGLLENQRKENQFEMKTLMQSKEQTLKKEGKLEEKHGQISGKQKERLKDNLVVNTDHLNKNNEDPPQSTALVKAQSSKPMMTEKNESKHDAVHEDSVPSVNTGLCQAETPVAYDTLQIMGIMVTVHERKPSVNSGQRNDSTQKQMNAQVKEPTNSELDECHSSSGIEISKGNEFSNDLSKTKAKDIVVHNAQIVKEAQTEADKNSYPENVQEISTLETRENNISENVPVEKTALQQESSCNENILNARPQKETQHQDPLAEKSVPSTVSVPPEVSPDTQPFLYKHDMIAQENKEYTNDIAKENSGQSIRNDEVKNNTEEINTKIRQTTRGSENFTAEIVSTGLSHTNDSNRVHAETLIKHDAKPSMKEDTTMVKNPSKSRSTDGKNLPLLDEKRHDLTPPEPCNKTSPSNHLTGSEHINVSPEHQYKKAPLEEDSQMDSNVHIGSIAIRVVPSVTEKDDLKMVGKHDVVAPNEHKPLPSLIHEEKVNTLNIENRNKDLSSVSNEKQMQDSVEHTLGVPSVVSSVKKLPDSLTISNQRNSINTNNEFTQAERGKTESGDKSGKSVSEPNIQLVEGDYFQVQRVVETNNKSHNCANVGDTSDAVSKAMEPPGLLPNKTAISNEAYNEGKNGFATDQSKMKTVESSSLSGEDMNRKNRKTGENLAFRQSYGATERQSHKTEKREAGQVIYNSKQHRENQSRLTAKERLSSRNPNQTRETLVKEKPDVKPKPKDRVSTIPEISAIADYARLKVIVSEDQENTIQEFPPSKKEGFFPLIQSRHSRRPVFTADPQDLSVKEKSLPNKREISSKVNKEPKPLVFPITDKEHQRTGMFKLGDKDRPEKMLSDAKTNDNVLATGTKHAQHLKERIKLPTNHLKNQRSEEAVAAIDVQRQADQIHQSSNPPLQASSSFAVNRSRNTSTSQNLKSFDNSNPHGNAEELSSKVERIPFLDENCSSQPTQGQEENKQMTVKKDGKNKNTLGKTGEDRPDNLRQERLATQHGDATANQSRTRQLEKEQVSCIEVEKKAEDLKIKHMIEESRCSLAEEERRGTQREEERRARERKAIAIEIKERREKQREAERRAEKERKAKQTEEQYAAEKEKLIRSKQEIRTMNETVEKRRIMIGEEKGAKLREEEDRIKVDAERKLVKQHAQEEQQKRSSRDEHQKRAAQEEEQRRAAQEQQQRRTAKEEQQRRAVLEGQQMRALQEEQQRRAVLEEKQRRAVLEEKQRRVVLEEQQRRTVQEEQPRRVVKEQQRRTAQEEQQRRTVQEEQQRRAVQEEQQRRAVQEEQQKRTIQEEQQRRAVQEEQQRGTVQEEQQRGTVQEEQQRGTVQEEQQRRAVQEEQQRRTVQEEQQRRTVQEEQQRRAVQEEQQKRTVQEEQQRRAVQEEQQRGTVQEEQQRRTVQEEQQRGTVQEEQQRRTVQEEQQRRTVQEEQQRRTVQEEQQRGTVQEEQQRRASLTEEQQRRTVQEEQQKRASLTEEQQRRTALIEEQRIAKQTKDKIRVDIEQENKIKQSEAETDAQKEERIHHTQEQKKADHQIEEQRSERQKREEWIRTQREEEERRAGQNVKTIIKAREEKQLKEERTRFLGESQTALKEGANRVAKEQMQGLTEEEIRAKRREEEEDKLGAYRERTVQTEEQKRAAQRMDALQYYAITSTESERKPREKQLCSPLPSQQRNNPPGLESIEDSHTRPYRPHAPASPAPSLPRSNTSSPALGTKPSMFRVKDNTIRGSSFTKSVKPRFHKNFAEDFQVGSPMGSERGEEEQETVRRRATTPSHPDTGLNRLTTIKESLAFQTAPSSQNYPTPLPHHRPYTRRSIALDEDDSRSVISNMSEDVESFATSAADLADVRGLYDYERPESACSFSSDVSRSLGKPPVVPPKSEKALRRAQRLTTRRIKKESSKAVADKPLQEVSSNPSSSIEVRSLSRHAVASPHFSSPVSLAHAPRMESSLSSCHTENPYSHSSFYASSHATGPSSLPAASPHATARVSLPVASPHAPDLACHPAAPKTIADVPSSPTLHHANHPAPVTQYHVESTYPQSYPLTQRKVLQDLGSGQYFVVDVPVEVKMKTFFDPETGKYVQLNVRESTKSTSRPQPQLQPQIHVKPHQQSLTPDSAAGKPLALFQGYHGYPQSYQPAAINSLPLHRPSVPGTLHQTQEPVIESHIHKYSSPEIEQGSKVHHYSPEKTPYMDTVNDTNKTHNAVYNTDGPYQSFPECDTDSKLVGSSVCENDNSAHSRYQPRDIITMSELDDFMELSDW